MSEAVIAALITAAATVAAQLLISARAFSRREAEDAAKSALILRRLDELEEKVSKHNNLVERIYITEAAAASLQKQLDGIQRQMTKEVL